MHLSIHPYAHNPLPLEHHLRRFLGFFRLLAKRFHVLLNKFLLVAFILDKPALRLRVSAFAAIQARHAHEYKKRHETND